MVALRYIMPFLICLAVMFFNGCQSPRSHRKTIDKAVNEIITQKQAEALGKTYDFSIERPSDILRRRLITDQNLPYSSRASLGAEELQKPKYWPEHDFPAAKHQNDSAAGDIKDEIVISLNDALQIGAKNSFEYQTQKEEVFRTALSLELERDAFRNTFAAQLSTVLSTDASGKQTKTGMEAGGEASVSRRLKSGAEISSSLAIDLANLFTPDSFSSRGVLGDASISVPLLRGSGRHIVTEPLTQAEREVVYAMWNFEEYKKSFAVKIANQYLSVLQQLDAINNSEADYRSRIASARRTRRLADAGRIQEIEVDQAVQNELRARQRWIASIQSYKSGLDSFKVFLGLPADCNITLDPNELERLVAPTKKIIEEIAQAGKARNGVITTSSVDTAIELPAIDHNHAGPYEFNEPQAVQMAFDNRLDLRIADGRVYDAQRAVIVAADALGAELTFFGSAQYGSRRTLNNVNLENSQLRTNKGIYSALLTLDLPFERTAEAISYRNSFIELERFVRDVQILEDEIKSQIRNTLRNLLEARENMYIQAKAVYVAEKRVRSVNMFLEAGRAQTRDLLEAQDALLSAQNDLTASVVDYRNAELEIQKITGVLEVDEKGLWQEYVPQGVVQ